MRPADSGLLWLTMAAVGVGTYLIRLSFVGLLGRTGVPPWAVRLLRFVPPAALAALVVPAVLWRGADPGFHLGNERLLAAALAAAIALKSRNVLATIAGGMLALWGLQWLGG